jgi:hypothetical protein
MDATWLVVNPFAITVQERRPVVPGHDDCRSGRRHPTVDHRQVVDRSAVEPTSETDAGSTAYQRWGWLATIPLARVDGAQLILPT